MKDLRYLAKQGLFFLLPLALATIVTATGFKCGFFVDDFYLLDVLEGYKTPATVGELYTFAPGSPQEFAPFLEKGPLPWWSLPNLKVRFYRPLSSWLFQLDYALFGKSPLGWHVHSLLWYLLVVGAWTLLARRVLPERTALLATVLFAISSAHWMPAVWAANRNALVATAGPLFGVWAHVRWREERWNVGLPVSLLCYASGMLGGETWLGVLGYVAAFELFGRREPIIKRMIALLPATLAVFGYLIAYKAFGFGVYGAGPYIDPLASPLQYLAALPGRLLGLLGGFFFIAPLDAWVFAPTLRIVLAATGLLAMVFVGWLLRSTWHELDEQERLAMRWLIPGGLLSMLPVASAFPMNRLLLVPSVAGCAVVACLIRRRVMDAGIVRRIFTTGKCAAGEIVQLPRRRVLTIAISLLAMVHLVIAPLTWPAYSALFNALNATMVGPFLAAPIDDTQVERQHVVVLIANNPATCIYPPIVRAVYGHPLPQSWHVLSASMNDCTLERTGPNKLVLKSVKGGLTQNPFLEICRNPAFGFRNGEKVELDGLRLTLRDVVDGQPHTMEVVGDAPFNDPSYLFLEWNGAALVRCELPRIGETRTIHAAPLIPPLRAR